MGNGKEHVHNKDIGRTTSVTRDDIWIPQQSIIGVIGTIAS